LYWRAVYDAPETSRLRINAQLVDTHTDFPLWSER
jgi:TolB-like protein